MLRITEKVQIQLFFDCILRMTELLYDWLIINFVLNGEEIA